MVGVKELKSVGAACASWLFPLAEPTSPAAAINGALAEQKVIVRASPTLERLAHPSITPAAKFRVADLRKRGTPFIGYRAVGQSWVAQSCGAGTFTSNGAGIWGCCAVATCYFPLSCATGTIFYTSSTRATCNAGYSCVTDRWYAATGVATGLINPTCGNVGTTYYGISPTTPSVTVSNTVSVSVTVSGPTNTNTVTNTATNTVTATATATVPAPAPPPETSTVVQPPATNSNNNNNNNQPPASNNQPPATVAQPPPTPTSTTVVDIITRTVSVAGASSGSVVTEQSTRVVVTSAAQSTVIAASVPTAAGSSSSSAPKTGTIVGAAVGGGVAALAFLALILFLCLRLRKKKQQPPPPIYPAALAKDDVTIASTPSPAVNSGVFAPRPFYPAPTITAQYSPPPAPVPQPPQHYQQQYPQGQYGQYSPPQGQYSPPQGQYFPQPGSQELFAPHSGSPTGPQAPWPPQQQGFSPPAGYHEMRENTPMPEMGTVASPTMQRR